MDITGFIRRLLGLEVKPGEPEKLSDASFDEVIKEDGSLCFVHFYTLCSASCQVMGGLLNEIGPNYIGKANFYKMDIRDNPYTPQRFNITGVPAVVVFKDGKPVETLTRLTPLNQLKEWIEKNIQNLNSVDS
ncbi:MAG: thioredoxin domain-containing protein [Candidatus Krumholzibacteriota bacterium]|nr:thioredoxin domain-containing protein [Candidatus Krumholzibacteriota bacterium]